MLGRLIKLIFILALLAFIGLVGYAYLGDMSSDPVELNEPVTLDVN